MKYSPNAKIAPQRQSSKGRALGAPASGGVKGKAMDPPVAQLFRKILHKKLGELARGSVLKTGYGSMGATKVPSGGGITMAGQASPNRGQKFTAASRNGMDTGVVGPSIVPYKKRGVSLADTPPSSRASGHPAHKGSHARSHTRGGKRVRQQYGG